MRKQGSLVPQWNKLLGQTCFNVFLQHLWGLALPMLCVLGGDAAPASGTGLTWPLKFCSVWANVPAGSSRNLEFCFQLYTPVPGIGCTAKALGFA